MTLMLKCVPFADLNINELYAIMVLRQEVFVLEQNCPFVDADNHDQKAWHLMYFDEANCLVAYTRLFDKNIYYEGYTSIGRVVSSSKVRGKGVGRLLIQTSIDYCFELFGRFPIKIGAQSYLKNFYQSFGFEPTGIEYLEDGIEHNYMILPVSK